MATRLHRPRPDRGHRAPLAHPKSTRLPIADSSGVRVDEEDLDPAGSVDAQRRDHLEVTGSARSPDPGDRGRQWFRGEASDGLGEGRYDRLERDEADVYRREQAHRAWCAGPAYVCERPRVGHREVCLLYTSPSPRDGL